MATKIQCWKKQRDVCATGKRNVIAHSIHTCTVCRQYPATGVSTDRQASSTLQELLCALPSATTAPLRTEHPASSNSRSAGRARWGLGSVTCCRQAGSHPNIAASNSSGDGRDSFAHVAGRGGGRTTPKSRASLERRSRNLLNTVASSMAFKYARKTSSLRFRCTSMNCCRVPWTPPCNRPAPQLAT